MRNEDNDCIRYLMKEMDPSEELLMERAMMEDEDLLIEVESMRQTLQKLDQLPEMEPPSDVTDACMEKAAEQAEQNRKSNSSYRKPAVKYAVAATLALTITAGGAWFFIGSEGDERQQASVAATSSPSQSTAVKSAGTQMATDQNMQQVSTSSAESAEPHVEPWVDRNDILRFEDQRSGQNSNFEAILQQSAQKLQRIEGPCN
ncbi:MAG: hypothetical protein U5J63_04925 [Fodinibius sp.]|nr:hypothetical protein [Fodinibius sp.]